MMKRLLYRIGRQQARFLRLVSITVLSLILLLFGGVAFAAPASPTGAGGAAQAAAGVYVRQSGPASMPLASTPLPSCDAINNPGQCAQNVTGKLAGGAGELFQLGIWAIVIVASLVILWQILQAVTKGAQGNSMVIRDVVVRVAIVGILVFLAINSQNIMDWFLGNGGSSPAIPVPTYPPIQ